MSFARVKFYDEKKMVVTNILDAAVKTLDFDQKAYIKTKAQLMKVIETPGFEGLGLGEIVAITNKLISKVANHTGYVIVNSKIDMPQDDRLIDQLGIGTTPQALDASGSNKPGIIHHDPKELGQIGKNKLLQLVKLLPPLISKREMETYTKQIEVLRFGMSTGASSPRTTGDLEKNIVEQIVEAYLIDFDYLVRHQADAFYELVDMAGGESKKIDISDKLRKQLNKAESIGEFLSIRDLVKRHIDGVKQPDSEKDSWGSLMFWKKK
ncbi:MAG: hypothetical protein KBT51_02660 [Cycloclasticus sp.]|nr:hypothetical protein [Cycloclasticus sp.]